MTEQARFPEKTVFLLTATGAIPFIGLAVAMALLDAPTNSTAALWLQTYSAVILSFLGGIRWGLALTSRDPKPGSFVLSVCPCLAGWAILPPAIILAPGPIWFLAYAGLFALQLLWDLRSAEVPSSFKPLRLGVSLVVIASLIAAWGVQRFLF
ncbi:DUF3429 domain-containing protein [Henriciella barbarensis]|uniref:DUF3429 domain-containing protein n=1 Tax=Henriciella barbarensis TaxID=86342 RepID=A0A399R2K7_9PROT|nr:DUF3429 domain-containing protein [Henriciella barbarensis]RIJ24445.1 DUF3429 domain-containing protein [Henriciella barbarensis]